MEVSSFRYIAFVCLLVACLTATVLHVLLNTSPSPPSLSPPTSVHAPSDVHEHSINADEARRTTTSTTTSSSSSTYPEDQCIHMTEHRYNQNNPFLSLNSLTSISSAYVPLFYRVLMEYSDFHRHHFHLHNFNFTEDLLHASSKESPTKYFFVYLDTSGLCNRLQTVLSAFVWSLLTKRVLLIQAKEFPIGELLCQPFKGSNWLWPEGINIDQIGRNAQERGDTNKIILVHGTDSDGQEAYITKKRNLDNFQIIVMSGGEMYFVPIFYLNPDYRKLLMKWFPHNNIGTYLTRFLFHPRDDVWASVLNTYQTLTAGPNVDTSDLRWFYSKPPTETHRRMEDASIAVDPTAALNKSVGTHNLRSSDPSTAATTQASHHRQLIDVSGNTAAPTTNTTKQTPLLIGFQLRNTPHDHTWNCLDKKEQNHFYHFFHNPNYEYRLFVSSMFPLQHHFRGIEDRFGGHLPYNWKFYQEYIDGTEEHTLQQFKHALHDIWMLSMMDESILNAQSSFAYIAMMLRGTAGLFTGFVYIPSDEEYSKMKPLALKEVPTPPNGHKTPFCYRIKSTEACFHRRISGQYNNTNFLSRCEDTYPYNLDTGVDKRIGWKLISSGTI